MAVVERAALPVRACSQLPRRSSLLSTVRADAPSCALHPCPCSILWLRERLGAMSTHAHAGAERGFCIDVGSLSV